MTRNRKEPTKAKPARPRPLKAKAARVKTWRLQDAKARFSELVRLAQSSGPQRVTVHGRDAVVVVSAEEFDRGKGPLTGADIVKALMNSPHKDVDLGLDRPWPRTRQWRDVEL